jgi:hypothetical protein
MNFDVAGGEMLFQRCRTQGLPHPVFQGSRIRALVPSGLGKIQAEVNEQIILYFSNAELLANFVYG